MQQLAENWTHFLTDAGPGVAFPLVVGSLLLMGFGWRLWRFALALTYAVGVGAAFYLYGRELPSVEIWAPAVVLASALLAYRLGLYALAGLGGLLGSAVLTQWVAGWGLPFGANVAAMALGALVGCAVAALNLRQVCILLTAFEGAVLLVSALNVVLLASGGSFRSFANYATSSSFTAFFVVLVPAVMSCFYQMSDARRCALLPISHESKRSDSLTAGRTR